MRYQIQDVLLLFFIYAFLGWCGEVAFAACKNRRFVNRGFFNGPICPIYGFGVMTVALLLQPWEDDIALLYVGSAVLTTLLELVTGWALEKLFHTRWWDYSRMPLNIGGYVCLPFSFLWGAACVVVLKWIHAPLFALVQRLPDVLSLVLGIIFSAAFAVDAAVTFVTIHKLSLRLGRLTAIAGEIHAISDRLGENIADHTLATVDRYELERERAQERIEAGRELVEERRSELERRLTELRARRDALLRETHFGHRRLLDAFPNMVSLRHAEALHRLKEALYPHRSDRSDQPK